MTATHKRQHRSIKLLQKRRRPHMTVPPGISQRRACRVVGQLRSTRWRRPIRASDPDPSMVSSG